MGPWAPGRAAPRDLHRQGEGGVETEGLLGADSPRTSELSDLSFMHKKAGW